MPWMAMTPIKQIFWMTWRLKKRRKTGQNQLRRQTVKQQNLPHTALVETHRILLADLHLRILDSKRSSHSSSRTCWSKKSESSSNSSQAK
jgi:hypothetical protein